MLLTAEPKHMSGPAWALPPLNLAGNMHQHPKMQGPPILPNSYGKTPLLPPCHDSLQPGAWPALALTLLSQMYQASKQMKPIRGGQSCSSAHPAATPRRTPPAGGGAAAAIPHHLIPRPPQPGSRQPHPEHTHFQFQVLALLHRCSWRLSQLISHSVQALRTGGGGRRPPRLRGLRAF